jgi:hypothetical protein
MKSVGPYGTGNFGPRETSDKTHTEQNESALALIADMRADMDFCR